MGAINISRDEQEALRNTDPSEVEKLVERAVRDEQSDHLYALPLANCGPYVESKLHDFERAIVNSKRYKSPNKMEEARETIRRAGNQLCSAVRDMKRKLEEQERESELFYVDDQIMPPLRYTNHLTVRVSYQWRRSADEKWNYRSVTFTHEVIDIPDYSQPRTKRKPSAAKVYQDKQRELYQTWEHLMFGALHSVKEYLKEDGDGSAIPETYKATVDSYTKTLNNFSTRFWQGKASAS